MAGIACEFYIPDCSHSNLFSTSYVRCQKSQGHKILRCFPHCCPSHVHYRNCGTSLALAVHRPPLANTWHAFIVFTRADEQLYHVNDVVLAADIATQTRTRDNPLATHLRGMVANNGHFRFDEKQADGWHYGWKSGRSKVQREIQHVARAFIFEEINQLQWKVVGTTASAPFTIVSYRGEHNKRKKSAGQLQLPPSPNSHDEAKHIHYAMIFQYMYGCRLDSAPRDLIAWFEGLYYKEQGQHHSLPLLQPSQERPPAPTSLHAKICLAVALGLMRTSFTSQMDSHLVRHANAVLMKTELEQVFTYSIETILYSFVDGILNEYGVTQDQVAESIAGEMQGCSFSFADNFFARFIAQIREAYIAGQQSSQTDIIFQDINTTRRSMYDGTWLCQTQTIQYHQWSLSIKAGHYVRWLSIATSFHQRLISNSLYIRSTTPLYTTVPSQFDLDSQAHSLRLLPDGESCLANLAIDYVGYLTTSGDIHLMIYIFERPQLFCLMAHVTIVPYDEQTIVYSVDVKSALLAPNEPDFLDCEPSKRIELCNGASSASHGSFKLTYCRVTTI